MIATTLSFAQPDPAIATASPAGLLGDAATGAERTTDFSIVLRDMAAIPAAPTKGEATAASPIAALPEVDETETAPVPAILSGKAAIETGKILPPAQLPLAEDNRDSPLTPTSDAEIAFPEAAQPVEQLTEGSPMVLAVVTEMKVPLATPVDTTATPQPSLAVAAPVPQRAHPVAAAPVASLPEPETARLVEAAPVAKPAVAMPAVSAPQPAAPAGTAEGQERPADRSPAQRSPEAPLPAPALHGGPAPAELPRPEYASDLPQQQQPGTAANGAAAPAQPSVQQADLAALVDRLAAARAALSPLEVSMELDHPEFGEIGLNFRQDRQGTLTVDVTSAEADLGRGITVMAARTGAEAGTTSQHDGSSLPQSQAHSRSSAHDREAGDTAQRGAQTQRDSSEHPARRNRSANDRAATTEPSSRAPRRGTFA